MYRNSDKYIYVINSILVVLIFISFVTSKNVEVDTSSIIIENDSLITYLRSNYIENIDKQEEIIKEKKEEEKQTVETKKNEETTKKNVETKKEEAQKENIVSKNEEVKQESKKEEKKEEATTNKNDDVKVLETLTGSLAGYGPDCYGCTSFRTASGRYIGDGNIYYEDEDYGKIRIVAGDKSYPFGTIVRISNTYYGDNSDIYAIVLDRGGGVGKGKRFLFDLLFETESAASKAGSRKNVKFEILRLGY